MPIMMPMKQTIKRWLHWLAPQWTTALLSARSRAHSHRILAAWGCPAVNARLVERLGDRVQSGPFEGLTLTALTHAEQLGPFLLGVYESELDRAWQRVFLGDYTQIIDVGAKFGYYAVGLAKRYPRASVVAFDTDWWAREALAEMALANRASNVAIAGYCTGAWLARNVGDAAFMLCDAEGFEADLFQGGLIHRLATATLLIETHDCFVPGVHARLRLAFADSHEVIEFGDPSARRQATAPLDFLTDAERGLAEHEVRAAQRWLLCLPRTGANRRLQWCESEGPAANHSADPMERAGDTYAR